ncbi:putative RNA recognition motif domain, mei2-like RNA recognition, RNA-binding domain superfamily [Helianthus annuus]|nr:putative RNA recognition motif domain, mei2-like RNA recognition, RNA-binding domain superfamily [Helianthus annuus]
MEHTGRPFHPTLNPTAPEFRPSHPPPYTYYSYSHPHNFNIHRPPPVHVPVQSPVQSPVQAPPPLPPPSPTPTRTLLLSLVPHDVSESSVRRDLEVFGDVRAVQMDRVRDGLVTVHFYDLRQATEALHEIQEQHMQQQYRLRKHFDTLTLFSPENYAPTSYFYHANHCSFTTPPLPPPAPGLVAGRAVWAQFIFPVAAGFPGGHNQGTLVVFNLSSDVTPGTVKEIFEAFGCVKELRDTPLKKNQKFVEFYDTRDASKALVNINGKEINGNTVVVEFSRPGGYKTGPKHSRFRHISSVGSPPIIVPRKFPSESRPYRPPPPPSPSLKKIVKKQQPDQQGGCSWSKQRKGSRYTRERYDPRYLIRGDGVISESSVFDSRTTVMIKNIPNKYSQKLLLNMLDSHCIHCNEQINRDGSDSGIEEPLSSYDFVYLPIDFMNKCNVGYGFVNMTSPEATMRLYKAFHHQNWEVFNSKKICEVSYARLQGLDALKEHFKNSRFPCDAEEYMPVVFDPPRDGQRLTQTIPIVGRSIHTPSDHESECSLHSNTTVVEDVDSDDTAAGTSDSGGVDE